jgi:hypothetical protein
VHGADELRTGIIELAGMTRPIEVKLACSVEKFLWFSGFLSYL